MKTKTKPARKQLPLNDSPPSAKVKRPIPYDPRITITGRDSAGKIVASEKTDDHRKARQIAESWRGSGLTVEVTE